jgi:hypothetical protein
MDTGPASETRQLQLPGISNCLSPIIPHRPNIHGGRRRSILLLSHSTRRSPTGSGPITDSVYVIHFRYTAHPTYTIGSIRVCRRYSTLHAVLARGYNRTQAQHSSEPAQKVFYPMAASGEYHQNGSHLLYQEKIAAPRKTQYRGARDTVVNGR